MITALVVIAAAWVLAYVGARVGHEGTAMYVAGGAGVLSGIAVVRGIEAAINAQTRQPSE